MQFLEEPKKFQGQLNSYLQESQFPLQKGNQNKSELPELHMPGVGGSNLVENSTNYRRLLFPKGCVFRKRKH